MNVGKQMVVKADGFLLEIVDTKQGRSKAPYTCCGVYVCGAPCLLDV